MPTPSLQAAALVQPVKIRQHCKSVLHTPSAAGPTEAGVALDYFNTSVASCFVHIWKYFGKANTPGLSLLHALCLTHAAQAQEKPSGELGHYATADITPGFKT